MATLMAHRVSTDAIIHRLQKDALSATQVMFPPISFCESRCQSGNEGADKLAICQRHIAKTSFGVRFVVTASFVKALAAECSLHLYNYVLERTCTECEKYTHYVWVLCILKNKASFSPRQSNFLSTERAEKGFARRLVQKHKIQSFCVSRKFVQRIICAKTSFGSKMLSAQDDAHEVSIYVADSCSE